jgi:hypothetical protein
MSSHTIGDLPPYQIPGYDWDFANGRGNAEAPNIASSGQSVNRMLVARRH